MIKKECNTPAIINQIVKVSETVIDGEKINSIDARELWVFLESGQKFGDWIKNRVEKYSFIEGTDFISFHNSMKADNTYINTKEYTISIDMAKELSMVERNDKGKQARKYFIQCEKNLKLGNKPSAKMPTATEELEACVKMAGIFGLKGNQALLSANTAVRNLHGIDCMETLGITGLIAEDQEQFFTPTILGKKNSISAVKFNQALEAAGLQIGNRDHKNKLVWEATEKGKKYCQIVDTGKKHKGGSPVTQIKWSESVINRLT